VLTSGFIEPLSTLDHASFPPAYSTVPAVWSAVPYFLAERRQEWDHNFS
jgi:hypothetical protein